MCSVTFLAAVRPSTHTQHSLTSHINPRTRVSIHPPIVSHSPIALPSSFGCIEEEEPARKRQRHGKPHSLQKLMAYGHISGNMMIQVDGQEVL